jgi:hypothetical protein
MTAALAVFDEVGNGEKEIFPDPTSAQPSRPSASSHR